MQYTIRGIPPSVDRALRTRSRAGGVSLNEAIVEVLAEAAGSTIARKRRSLGDIAGAWRADKATEDALRDQDRLDERS